MKKSIAPVLGSLALAIFTRSSPALAAGTGEWPTFQHDFSRTGRADGAAALTQPAVAWTISLGARLGARQLAVADVDGTGTLDLVSIAAGKLEAHRADGTLIWRSAGAGYSAIYGVWDLDGQGTSEVVVAHAQEARALAGATGEVVLRLPSPAVADAVFLPEAQGGLVVLGARSGELRAYDTSAGLAAPPLAWSRAAGLQYTGVSADVNGDGTLDFVIPTSDGFTVADAATGVSKGPPLSFGSPSYPQRFVVTDVDGQPGAEIVSIDPGVGHTAAAGIRVMGWRTGALQVLWSSLWSAAATLDRDAVGAIGMVADLDGDGAKEIVYSGWERSATVWTTVVVDAATGMLLSAVTGGVVQAVTDLDGDGKLEVLTKDSTRADQGPTYSTLRLHDFDSRATGAMTKGWTLTGARMVSLPSSQVTGPSVDLAQAVVADFDVTVSGQEALVGRDPGATGGDTQLQYLHGGDGTTVSGPALGAGGELEPFWFGNGLTQVGSQADLVLAGRDGFAHAIARTGVVSGTFVAGSYSNWPTVARDDLGRNLIFINDAQRTQRWLDGTHLDLDGEPLTVFRGTQAHDTVSVGANACPHDPVFYVPGPSPVFARTAWDSTRYWLVGHDSTGVESWRTPLALTAAPRMPGAYVVDATGDAQADIVLTIDTSTGQTIAVYDALTGALIRSTPMSAFAPEGHAGGLVGALVDLNADGQLDLVTSGSTVSLTNVNLSSSPMGSIWTSPSAIALDSAGTIGAAPLVAPGQLDLFAVNGNYQSGPYYRLNLDGVIQATRDSGTPLAGAGDQSSVALVADGTGAYDLVSTGMSAPNLSQITRFDGATLNTVWTRFAADGIVTDTAPDQPVALREPLEVDVDGDGVEDVVFGADDGYLYAVRSDTGAKVFAVPLGASALHVVAANTDQDAALELVASLADGRLVALDDVAGYLATRDGSGGAGGSSGTSGAAGWSGGAGDTGASGAGQAGAPQGGSSAGGGTGGSAGAAGAVAGAGTSAGGTSAAGTSAAGTSAAGTSAGGTSAAGTSAAGTSAAGTSAGSAGAAGLHTGSNPSASGGGCGCIVAGERKHSSAALAALGAVLALFRRRRRGGSRRPASEPVPRS